MRRTVCGVLALATGLSLALPGAAAGKPRWIEGQMASSTVQSCITGVDLFGVSAQASFRADPNGFRR
jgi:hypothetical protein